jgi:hypothetical protein
MAILARVATLQIYITPYGCMFATIGFSLAAPYLHNILELL